VQVHSARRASRVTKPLAGHLAKAGVEAGEILKEFRVDAAKAAELSNGAVVGADLFEVGQKVDVQGVSIGKGYAGTIKRYNFAPVVPRTVTRVRTTCRVRSVWRRIRVAFSRVSA
jgi:ribosomal protein L3